ncbi:hypothetical protein PHISCL_06543 [Aspergillus sclerotialis]|uniref:Uncharacterized protein n=1 Tax=Aspergillus sclerotialis TaxID=2070753 RepID=A0A3A2ZD80_9EURO|nr:hypothetical protein PHISCL_06543 [Aspergillus sclerotialis]
MRSILIFLSLFALTFASPVLDKRACRNVGCKCAKGTKQGQYCGISSAVTVLGSGGIEDIYECNSSGGCCSYGPADKCRL